MLGQQFRVFIFLTTALVGLTTAAYFSYDNGGLDGYVTCAVTPDPTNNPGNFFFIYENQGWASSTDGTYRAAIGGILNTRWYFLVEDSAGDCFGDCIPIPDAGCPPGATPAQCAFTCSVV